MNINKEVNNLTRMVKILIETNSKVNSLTEDDVEVFIKQAMSITPHKFTEEEIQIAKKEIMYQFLVYCDSGKAIQADYDQEKWYDEIKENISSKFWTRYSNYLIDEKNFTPNIVSELGNETLDNKLMNFIGNPQKNFGLKRGLIIGDVQSGKTSTYIGLMCKAADAGYKVFILLTGVIESLRKQTQERVEEGFIGIDMSAKQGQTRVGVGKDNKPILSRALTSRISDFNSNIDKIAVSLGQSDAVVFVIKKQKNILENLRDWLINLNADPFTKQIDVPMLLIDDEADNASINVGKNKQNPTIINKLIRELANIFTKSNYVGFTATPFANVFIDPVKTEDMEYQDLFPEDFIVALPTPSNYIGANKIFRKDGEYHDQLIYIKDAGSVEEDGWSFWFKHKKNWAGELPDSLVDAVYTFYLANAMRDLRQDYKEHRSMLINISRFVKVQKHIKQEIESIHAAAYRAIKFNLSHNFDQSMRNPVIRKLYENWEKHYKKYEFTWDDIVEVLFTAIEKIQIKIVNSSKSSEKLVYPENESLRVIAIGGLALSRGLTLEGLIVSYFFRNTSTYDVLMQMGRWFGYRKNYEDLFRIWTHELSAEWYAEIAEATDMLKHDMDEMSERRLKPKNFGIRVRNNSEKLSITAPNKMKATTEEYEFTEFFGDIYETPYVSASPEKNIKNFYETENMIANCLKNGLKWTAVHTTGTGTHNMLLNVPKSYILDYLSKINVSKYSAYFDVKQIKDYISDGNYPQLDNWDIAFMDGGNQEKTFSFNNINIKLVERHKCSIEKSTDKLTLASRRKLGSPTDGLTGLKPEQIERAKESYKELYLKENEEPFTGNLSSYPSYTWFKFIKNRNPILLIYLIDVKLAEANNQHIQEKEFRSGMNGLPVIGLAIGFPNNASAAAAKIKYRVSTEYNYYELKENQEEVEEE